MQAQDVLDFWFDGVQSDPARLADRRQLWFGTPGEPPTAAAERDAQIRERFGPLLVARREGRLGGWEESPPGRLALILLADQFPRNVFRGLPQAFADDPDALALCEAGLERGDDARLAPIERVFFYLPLEHAESLAAQQRSVALFEALERSAPAGQAGTFASFTQFARLHLEIIARFGRFPHRNAILGRTSTPAETAYLAGDAPAFGQG